MIKCPSCDGIGELYSGFNAIIFRCDRCDGAGECPSVMEGWILHGKTLKNNRIARRVTLKDEAARLNIDVGILSKMERGIINPQ